MIKKTQVTNRGVHLLESAKHLSSFPFSKAKKIRPCVGLPWCRLALLCHVLIAHISHQGYFRHIRVGVEIKSGWQ